MTQKLPGQILGYPQAAHSADPTPDTSRAPPQAPPFRHSFSAASQWFSGFLLISPLAGFPLLHRHMR